MRQGYLLAAAIASLVVGSFGSGAAAGMTPAERLGPPGVSDVEIGADAGAEINVGAPVGGASSNVGGEAGDGAETTATPSSAPAARSADPNLGSGVLGEPGNPPGTSTAARFERLDTDHDGSISRAEARKDPTLSRKFAGADKNKDGKLSDAEYRNIDQP